MRGTAAGREPLAFTHVASILQGKGGLNGWQWGLGPSSARESKGNQVDV